MSARTANLGALLFLTAWTSLAAAQSEVTKDEFDRAIRNLSQQIGELKAQISREASGSAGASANANQQQGNSLQERLAALEQKTSDHDRLLYDQSAILQGIAKRQAVGDVYTLDIRGNMERSPAFRAELSGAVDEVMRDRQRGTLRIRNEMATGQTVVVNGAQSHYVAPNSTLSVDVPLGTVSTELPGYEAPKNWTVGPPNYAQEITIRPSTRYTTFRPVYDYSVAYSGWYYDPVTGFWSRILY